MGGIAAPVVAKAGPQLWNQEEVEHLWEIGIDVLTMKSTIKQGSKKQH